MRQYDRHILNNLLDSYENSLLFSGKNKVSIHIAFPFSKQKMPNYFDESSMEYEMIHACVKELEQRGYIEAVWKKGKENHIIQKVILKEDMLAEIYTYLHRKDKTTILKENITLLQRLQTIYQTPVCTLFISKLLLMIQEGKSVKDYIHLENLQDTEQLVHAIAVVEENRVECYVREFSIINFADSKIFERLLGTLIKVMKECEERFAGMDQYDILAEYSIYHTPNYVYFKGDCILQYATTQIDLKQFRNGIGIPGDVLPHICLRGTERIDTVITIENLTTFFRWSEQHAIMIYLGGYHNTVRRELLQLIFKCLPQAHYLHFGDIDMGGFEIYEDLCRKTKIPFKTYHMNVDTLKQYERYAKPLTERDRKRIESYLHQEKKAAYLDVLQYMLDHNLKLEQECIGLETFSHFSSSND